MQGPQGINDAECRARPTGDLRNDTRLRMTLTGFRQIVTVRYDEPSQSLYTRQALDCASHANYQAAQFGKPATEAPVTA